MPNNESPQYEVGMTQEQMMYVTKLIGQQPLESFSTVAEVMEIKQLRHNLILALKDLGVYPR